MRHEDHLGPQHRRDPYILGQVIVITNQEAGLDAQQVDHVVGIARRQARVNECVEFSIFCDESLGADGQIAVVEPTSRGRLDQPGHHDDAILPGDRMKSPGRRTIGNRLGHRGKLVTAQMLEKRVAGDRALMEADDLGPPLHGPPGQCFDPGKVVRLVVITMFELGGGDSDVSHARVLRKRGRSRYLRPPDVMVLIRLMARSARSAPGGLVDQVMNER